MYVVLKDKMLIRKTLNSKCNEHISGGKFFISSIGGCWRKKYLELKGIYKQEYSEETLRLFDIGNVIHRQITKELIEKESKGFHLVASEVNIPENKYISGRIDSIVSINNQNVIVDIKSASDWTMKNIRKTNDCDENYKNQVLLYMYFTGIHKGILLFVGKTKGELEEIEVRYDEGKARGFVKEIEDFFHNYVEKNIEPPKCDGGQWGCKCCGVGGKIANEQSRTVVSSS